MRLFLVAVVSLFLVCLSVAGQVPEPCTLGMDKAPAIRGIRLGMTLSEVRALYPNISEPKERDEVGASATIYIDGIHAYDDRLKGVNSLYLHFFSGRLYHISVTYKEPSYWREVTELTKPLDLPNKDYARAECQGFEATLFRYSDRQTLDLTDTLAQRKIIALTQEMEENSADCQKTPIIRGVRLGMTVGQFRTLYPRAQISRKRSEIGELVLKLTGRDPRLEGISTLWAYFLDGELYFLVIDYTNQIEWVGIDQFVEHFSKAIGLRTKWDGYSDDRTLRCHSFVVKAEISAGHPRVMIQDRVAVVKLNKREEQLKSPANFRP